MKKAKVVLLLFMVVIYSSCATVFGGKITDCQRKPPGRQLRVAPFVLDILFVPYISLPVDFLTGAIYKPCPRMVHYYHAAPADSTGKMDRDNTHKNN